MSFMNGQGQFCSSLKVPIEDVNQRTLCVVNNAFLGHECLNLIKKLKKIMKVMNK